jgi:hypothetical protein
MSPPDTKPAVPAPRRPASIPHYPLLRGRLVIGVDPDNGDPALVVRAWCPFCETTHAHPFRVRHLVDLEPPRWIEDPDSACPAEASGFTLQIDPELEAETMAVLERWCLDEARRDEAVPFVFATESESDQAN